MRQTVVAFMTGVISVFLAWAMPAVTGAQTLQTPPQRPQVTPPGVQTSPLPERPWSPGPRSWSGEHRPRRWGPPYWGASGWYDPYYPYYPPPPYYQPAPVYVPSQWVWNGWNWTWVPDHWEYLPVPR